MTKAPRWNVFRMAVSICLVIVACKSAASSTEVDEPPRPRGVPEKAVWAGGLDGGAFVLLSPTSSAGRYAGKIYDDNTGEVLFSGTLRLDAKAGTPINVADRKTFQAWDGATLHLTDGRTLRPEGK